MNMNATKLLNAIEEFRKFDADIQSQTIAVFLYVGLHSKSEGVPMTVIAEKLAMAQSSVSRNVSLLSKYSWRQKEGLNFLVAEEDPFERRRKLVKLTNRGKRLYETISQ
jgi:DNA-binding MarR family transcriptional regulator